MCVIGIIKKIVKKVKISSAEKKYGNMQFEKISFGSYPQSDPKTAEPIEWLVLKKQNGKAILMSDKILHSMVFAADDSDYSKSDVRNWLNGAFYNTAFSEEEKSRLVSVDCDKVTLLSYETVKELLPAPSLRIRQVTEVAKRVKHAHYKKKAKTGSWMLSSSSDALKYMPAIQIVGGKGEIDPMPISAKAPILWGVVPVIIIQIS